VVIRSPLARLIHMRLQELGIDAQALGFRLGYRNPAKAAGRVYALCDGHLANHRSKAALARLPDALALPSDFVEQAVIATEKAILWQERQRLESARNARHANEAKWRRGFSPHAVIYTERTVPSQIMVCGLTGGIKEWLIIPLNHSQPPITFVQQVLSALPEKLRLTLAGSPCVPFFGRALGFIINYSPEKALRCSLTGQPLEVLAKAYRPGEIDLYLGTRRVPNSTAARLVGCD
jgi:hypothetical protein